MFKIICLILVFFTIKAYTLKCYQCGIETTTTTPTPTTIEPETKDKRFSFSIDDYTGGDCKDKNDNGTQAECPKDKTLCFYLTNGKDTCRCTFTFSIS